MEFLDRHTFEDCMRQVFSRFDRQEEMLASMQEARQEKPPLAGIMEDDTMDNQDVCMLLRVSKRTLQRYRSAATGCCPTGCTATRPTTAGRTWSCSSAPT